MTMENQKRALLADGTSPLLGLFVHRINREDGSPRAGKARGPKLIIQALRDYDLNGDHFPAGLAVLREKGGLKKQAGTEPVWLLRRAQGFQPACRKPRPKREPGQLRKEYGVPVFSFRMPTDMRDEIVQRGEDIGTIVRRDLARLYDLIDSARALMLFPAGTLDELAKAWTLCAPPPPQNTLRPQWFVPVLLDACRRLNNETAMKLASYAETWNSIESLAVQDAVERWEPEASDAQKLRRSGLREETDEDDQDALQAAPEPRRATRGRK
jgi:hypothetical protein